MKLSNKNIFKLAKEVLAQETSQSNAYQNELQEEYNNDINEMLLEATRENNLEKVQWCLNNDANANAFKNLPIQEAAEYGNTEIVQLLIDSGADPNTSNGFPLMEAVKENHIDTVKVLLDNGASVTDSILEVAEAELQEYEMYSKSLSHKNLKYTKGLEEAEDIFQLLSQE